MGKRYDQAQQTNMIVLEKLKNFGKFTISELSSHLGWTVGKVQGAINRLLKENKIYRADFPDYDSKIFKVYYSVDPINFDNDIYPSFPLKIPKYYKFLDELFGNLLSSGKNERKIILNQIKEMGLTMNYIINMQNKATMEEMKNDTD